MPRSRFLQCFLSFRFVLGMLVFVQSAQAQSISVTRPFSFGQAIVTDNSMPYEVLLNPNGTFSGDSQFIFTTNPQSGVLQLTGAAPNQAIGSVVVTVDQQLLGGGQQFTLDNFTTNFPANVDSVGSATITLGGRLLTTGNGVPYNGSVSFSGLLTITVNLI